MTDALFERLLYEEESTTLDFKKEQYLFAKASDDDKSEILKDVLGFVNAWRRSEAYILIGVEDVRGGRSNVVGIPAADHLDDHSLQQFVNNLTNRPVRFHYEAFGFEGKQVGIIRIEEQRRPIYLKRDYGKLKRNDVYVRRGSSTDPTKPASPDEIAQMGKGGGPQTAEVVVEFAEINRDDSLGPKVAWDAEFLKIPKLEAIPDFEEPRSDQVARFDIPVLVHDSLDRVNWDFYRELALYEVVKRLYRPVRVVIKNAGQAPADNVRVEMVVPTNAGIMISARLPEPPQRRKHAFGDVPLTGFRPAALRSPGAVTIDTNDDRYRIEIDCGSLQPGRRVWSEVFYIGTRESGEMPLHGQIFSEKLPQPKDFTLTVEANVTVTEMMVDELLNMPDPAEDVE